MILAIVGPTATGKTAYSLRVVEAIRAGLIGPWRDAEIVNADSMQLYRGMDIGTAKATPAERALVAHHQLDVLHVSQAASVAAYQRAARATIAEIIQRGHLPIVVGGSGLYIRALLDKISLPGTNPQVRAHYRRRLEREGAAVLHGELLERDARAGAKISVGDPRRIVRALEVMDITGKPFSAHMPTRAYVQPTVQIALRVAPEILHKRIGARTAAMWQAGIVAETASLRDAMGPTAAHATGYAQCMDYLDGKCDQDACIEAITIATRQLARKQRTWFRADPRITWLDASAVTQPVAAVLAPLLTADLNGN
ncbi:MAG: tRNA (adenosine(37)-N6)-dimethylallyltransferase MiaA [Bowdeniella nasicola]|nr:tRNA (adenosine(37)-N6)-dimethylallyltransferase MiaA [Bowdeniella nasicola]